MCVVPQAHARNAANIWCTGHAVTLEICVTVHFIRVRTTSSSGGLETKPVAAVRGRVDL